MTHTLSAFDIAGAVVATPLAVMFWAYMLRGPYQDEVVLAFWITIAFTLWSAFCIARLCGATL